MRFLSALGGLLSVENQHFMKEKTPQYFLNLFSPTTYLQETLGFLPTANCLLPTEIVRC